MRYKLILAGILYLSAEDSNQNQKTISYSATAEVLKGDLSKIDDAQKTKVLEHAIYLDNKNIELRQNQFALEKERFEWGKENYKTLDKQNQTRYNEGNKSRNIDRIFLFGIIGLLTIYIIYKGTTDSKKEADLI